ncbi:hypothetical protein [Krasilnikovia sp. M28-CT-15]|uniref:hypothetical protein n=1 Tax=Krasilnikovia sp. M28-CT-15 TaxID=3373540 RepID=UPI00399D564A
MDDPNTWKPGKGLLATPDDTALVQAPHLDDATVRLVHRNVLIGGMPGAGKTGLLNLLTLRDALASDEAGTAGGVAGDPDREA